MRSLSLICTSKRNPILPWMSVGLFLVFLFLHSLFISCISICVRTHACAHATQHTYWTLSLWDWDDSLSSWRFDDSVMSPLRYARAAHRVCESEMTYWVCDTLTTDWCCRYTDWVNESSASHELNESSQSDGEWVDWLCVSHFDDALMSLSPLHYTHWICDTLTILWCRRYIFNGHWVRESEMTHWVRDNLTILWCRRNTCNGHRVRGGEMTHWVRDTLTIFSMSLLLHTCNGHRVRERWLIDFAKLEWLTDVTATAHRWSWRSFECVLRMTQQWCMMMEKSYGEIAYVYTFTCMYVPIYVYIHVFRHINLQMCICVYMNIYTSCIYAYIYVCVCVYICIYIIVCMFTYVYTHLYVYIYIYTHIYIYS